VFGRLRDAIVWLFSQDVPRKLSAIALGALMVYVAHQEITQDQTFTMQVETTVGTAREPQSGTLLVRLPSDEYNLRSPKAKQHVQVTVAGSLNEIERLGGSVSALLEIPPDVSEEPRELSLSDIKGNWSRFLGLDKNLAWKLARSDIRKIPSVNDIGDDTSGD